MKKMILFLALMTAFTLTSCEQVASILEETGITNDESVEALKTALSYGIDSGTTDIAKFGYANYTTDSTNGRGIKEDIQKKVIKILLPEEANQVLDYIAGNPVTNLAFEAATSYSATGMRSQLLSTINKAADTAAPQSISVFKNAITSMSISDGMSILTAKDNSGNKDSVAATNYLSTNTRTGLTGIYQPLVANALSKVGAATTWTKFAGYYNNVLSLTRSERASRGLPDSLPTKLDAYATEKALDGLFVVVGHEEIKIRRNPFAYASGVVQRVFSKL